MFANMRGNNPGVGVKPTTGRKAYYDTDSFSVKKLIRG
jgi:hypothetical protein